MKKLSIVVLAIVLATATVFANGQGDKTVKAAQTKQECKGQCAKGTKTGTCKDKATCSDMNSCKNRCS
jgi:hypothetical protein